MKKSLFLLALLAIIFIANPEAEAQCPPGWNGPNQSTFSEGGCFYLATWCYRDYLGYCEIAISGLTILPPCDPSNFESSPKTVTNALMQHIAESGFLLSEFGIVIPECPGHVCIFRYHDGLCYNGWIPIKIPPSDPNDPPTYLYIMNVCVDNFQRSCNETIRVCWKTDENGQRVLEVMRTGYPSGPDCPDPCELNCD